MAIVPYHGSYERFRATSKQQGILLMSADCLIGDPLNPIFGMEEGTECVWLENRFGKRCGQLDPAGVGTLSLCRAKGWNIRILLASVYATTEDDGMGYWGEVVVLGYPDNVADSFDVFADGVGKLLSEGTRPQVDLHQSSLAQICESKGAWLPSGRVDALHPEGSALAKGHMSFNDKMIDQARKRNPGCLFVGWAFIALLVLGAAWLVKTLLGF